MWRCHNRGWLEVEVTGWLLCMPWRPDGSCSSLCLFQNVQRGSGAHPVFSSMAPFQRAERRGPETDHSCPSNAELNNEWRYVSTRLCQCFSNAGPRPGTGPWHQFYRAARGSPGICRFSFLRIFHE